MACPPQAEGEHIEIKRQELRVEELNGNHLETETLERQKTDATDKVDAGLDDILGLLDFRKKPGEVGAEPKPKMDEYEKIHRELNFETRAKPQDR